jgi:hypothetical protein
VYPPSLPPPHAHILLRPGSLLAPSHKRKACGSTTRGPSCVTHCGFFLLCATHDRLHERSPHTFIALASISIVYNQRQLATTTRCTWTSPCTSSSLATRQRPGCSVISKAAMPPATHFGLRLSSVQKQCLRIEVKLRWTAVTSQWAQRQVPHPHTHSHTRTHCTHEHKYTLKHTRTTHTRSHTHTMTHIAIRATRILK